MKVNKDSVNISNKKKNALPSSKLLKPKNFKSLKKPGNTKKHTLSKQKVNLVKFNEHISAQSKDNVEFTIQKKSSSTGKVESGKKTSELKGKQALLASSPVKSKKNSKESETKNIPTLFDFVTSQGHNRPSKENVKARVRKDEGTKNPKDKISKPGPLIANHSEKHISQKLVNGNKNNKTRNTPNKHKLKTEKSTVLQKESKKEKILIKTKQGKLKKHIEDKQLSNRVLFDKYQNEDKEATEINKCKLKANKVADVTKGLLKLINDASLGKPEMLDIGEPIFLQVECIKIPICVTKQLRFKLPHALVDETSDVLLITADLKGHKIYPDRAVDHYEELLAKLKINFINKVMPLRMVKKEYSQYELKRKLVDQFDMILADSRITKSLPAVLGKFVLYKRKMPIPVNLSIGEQKLKKHLEEAICKTQMTVKSNGHTSIVQIGHSKMAAKDIATNIVEVAKSLESLYPGGWRNVRSLVVKTAKSTSLPVYLSLLSPNEVRIPVEIRKKPEAVEDELSTMPGYRVTVTADGNVILKKVEEDLKIDDSKDDEILEEAKNYVESSKTVRYDESSDEEKNEGNENSDSDDEGDAITDAMEKKLLNKYEKNVKAKKNKEEDEIEEESEEDEVVESEAESQIIPKIGKKRKNQGTKKQSQEPPAKKQFKTAEPKGTNKNKSTTDNKKSGSPGLKKPQTRGTRGGKKNKMSKDQRKALIKRRKAGKK